MKLLGVDYHLANANIKVQIFHKDCELILLTCFGNFKATVSLIVLQKCISRDATFSIVFSQIDYGGKYKIKRNDGGK